MIGFKCAFFRRRNVCDGTPQILSPLSGPSGYSTAGSSFDIPVSVTTISGLSGFAFDLTGKPAVGILGKGDIKTIYNRASTTATVFKVIIKITPSSTIPTAAQKPEYSESISVTAFGTQIYNKVFSHFDDYTNVNKVNLDIYSANGQEFYVYSSDLAAN